MILIKAWRILTFLVTVLGLGFWSIGTEHPLGLVISLTLWIWLLPKEIRRYHRQECQD